MIIRNYIALTALVLVLFFSGVSTFCWADGSSIDKVYLPYVQPLEKELEYRALFESGANGFGDDTAADTERSIHKLGYGFSVNEHWFVEAYLLGERLSGESIKIEGYELEAKLQLTEQGELDIDWGLLLELEKSKDQDSWEAKVGLLGVKDWGSVSAAGNVFVIREWGGDIRAEMEAAVSFQLRYRMQPEVEPGVEFYASQDTRALGPVVMGRLAVGSKEKLFWHLGAMLGVGKDTADRTVKLQLEYEYL